MGTTVSKDNEEFAVVTEYPDKRDSNIESVTLVPKSKVECVLKITRTGYTMGYPYDDTGLTNYTVTNNAIDEVIQSLDTKDFMYSNSKYMLDLTTWDIVVAITRDTDDKNVIVDFSDGFAKECAEAPLEFNCEYFFMIKTVDSTYYSGKCYI